MKGKIDSEAEVEAEVVEEEEAGLMMMVVSEVVEEGGKMTGEVTHFGTDMMTQTETEMNFLLAEEDLEGGAMEVLMIGAPEVDLMTEAQEVDLMIGHQEVDLKTGVQEVELMTGV